MRRGLLLVLVLAGCPKKAPESWVSQELQQWAPPPGTVEYTRVNFAGPIPLPNVWIRDTWQGPVLDGGRLLYDVHTVQLDDGLEEPLETVRVFYGPEGFGYVGTLNDDGTVEHWDPPQVVLPPDPSVGDTWEDTHQKGPVTSVRACEILASEYCGGGLVSVCESERQGGRVILRDHFCPGVGWSGFEAMALTPERPPVRMWSEKVVRDGVKLPEPEPEPVEEPRPSTDGEPAEEPTETPEDGP